MVIEQCASGRWFGWPKDREDVIASGETREEVIQNLKELYIAVIEYETIMKDRRVIIQQGVYMPKCNHQYELVTQTIPRINHSITSFKCKLCGRVPSEQEIAELKPNTNGQ